MAVDLWLEVEAEPASSPRWEFVGEGAALLRNTPNPLSELPFKGRVVNQVPVGVGLGSSAAARVARAALLGSPDLLTEVGRQEGHLDNAAAALEGGVVAVVAGDVHRLPTPDLAVALFVAAEPLPTEKARAALPEEVPRTDVVFNLGRVALLVDILHRGDWERLAVALEDRLHQPHRLPLYPWAGDVMRAARAAGAYGAAVAGAGPSVFALCQPDRAEPVAAAMAAAGGAFGRSLVTKISAAGTSVQR